MRCPFCGTEDTQVKDSRQGLDSRSVKRRRFCMNCSSRFTTYERLELREITVIKKDGSKRPFDREKTADSIRVAIRKRSITNEQVEMIVNNLIKKIEKSGDFEVTTKEIGQIVMEELAKLDDVAYVRFASVYHDFANVKDFENFLHKISSSAANSISNNEH